MVLSFDRGAIRLALTLVLLSGQLPAASWEFAPTPKAFSVQWPAQALSAPGDCFFTPRGFTAKAAITLAAFVLTSGGLYEIVHHPKPVLAGVTTLGGMIAMAILSSDEEEPYWGVRLITDEEARPLRAGHSAIVQLQMARDNLLGRTLGSLKNYLLRHRSAIEAANVWINPATLDLGLIAQDHPRTVRQKAVHTKNWLSRYSVLLPLWRQTSISFWETLYRIHEEERQRKQVIQEWLDPYFYFGDFYADWPYTFENFRASILLKSIPADHLFFQLKTLHEQVPHNGQPKEDIFWDFMFASEKTNLSMVMDLWEKIDFTQRRHLLLEALTPLLNRLDEMPLQARLYAKTIVATYFFQVGKNQISFLNDPLTPKELIARLDQRITLAPQSFHERLLITQRELAQKNSSTIDRRQDLDRFLNSAYTRLSVIWASYFLALQIKQLDSNLQGALYLKTKDPYDIDGLFTYLDNSIHNVNYSRSRFKKEKAEEKIKAADVALQKLGEFRKELTDLINSHARDRKRKGFGPTNQLIWGMPFFLTLGASVLATPIIGVIVGTVTLAVTLWAWTYGVEGRRPQTRTPAPTGASLRCA